MNELQLYVQDATPLEEAKQKAWLSLGAGKGKMDAGLKAKELGLSIVLKDYETKPLPEVTEAIATYTKLYKELVDYRKGFTKFLDMAKDQCMAVEKANDPANNPTFKAAVARELSLRKEAQEVLNAAQRLEDEKAAFKTHFQNGYHASASSYRMSLMQIASSAYSTCLKTKTPVDGVHVAVSAAQAAMKELVPVPPVKFDRVLLKQEDATIIFNNMLKPDYAAILNEQLKELETKFSLYANDLQLAEQALKLEEEKAAADKQRMEQELETAQATNTLMNNVSATVVTATGFKPPTEKETIKIKDNDPQWVVYIITAFLANFNAAWEKVGVKNFSSLSVKQMANALDKAGIRVSNVEYEKTEK